MERVRDMTRTYSNYIVILAKIPITFYRGLPSDLMYFEVKRGNNPVGIRRPLDVQWTSIDVYMKSRLHIDVHWTSKERLMPTGK